MQKKTIRYTAVGRGSMHESGLERVREACFAVDLLAGALGQEFSTEMFASFFFSMVDCFKPTRENSRGYFHFYWSYKTGLHNVLWGRVHGGCLSYGTMQIPRQPRCNMVLVSHERCNRVKGHTKNKRLLSSLSHAPIWEAPVFHILVV